MTTPPPDATMDPRIGLLGSLVLTLLDRYDELRVTVAGHLPDRDREAFALVTDTTIADVRTRLAEIVVMTPKAPTVDG
ncbi:hypothetical protein [Embleya sp. AB8]|uniref:hypothetical protein n=1 Tax=Embleya sp. AB8 TaxID=3156304 RepID=UPI003C70C195